MQRRKKSTQDEEPTSSVSRRGSLQATHTDTKLGALPSKVLTSSLQKETLPCKHFLLFLSPET